MSSRPASALLAVTLLCALAACSAPTAPQETPSPSESVETSGSVPDCPEAGVEVGTADELRGALADARPGDVIRLSDGTYAGSFVASVPGTADAPIHLCGGAGAVLDGGDPDEGIVLQLEGADHWMLLGFTVQNGQKGVMVDGSSNTVVGGLTVRRIGDEGIHLRRFSSGNDVVGNAVSDTGLRKPEFGEGIYVGTAESNWCEISDCEPDRSDGNRIVGNTVSATTAESVDIKEGTSGGLVADNVFDGSDLAGDADSWVDVKGNDWVIEGNRGTDSPGDGFQTHEILDGWGSGNRFSGNTAVVNGPGFGFALTPERDNVVACDNVAEGAAAGLANVDCAER